MLSELIWNLHKSVRFISFKGMLCSVFLQLGSECIMNLSTSILYPVFGKASHMCAPFEGGIFTFSWKYVCLDDLFIMSAVAWLNLLYNPPRSSYLKSVCVSTSWVHAFQLSIADGHNRPVMADIVSEEQLQHSGVEGLVPGPLYKRIYSVWICTKLSNQPLPLISWVHHAFLPLCYCVCIFEMLCLFCPVVLYVS